MSELSTQVQTGNAPAKPVLRTGGAMGALIPQTIEEAFRLAEGLVRGGGAPRNVDTMQAFTIISKGLEVGFAPMQALATIANINGRLSIYGDGLIAIARRGGNKVKETIEGNGDARVATCTITRADNGEIVTRTFSVDDAKRAKLWQKGGPWTQYPDRMLAARARGFAIRDGLADKLFGLHVAEESEDIPVTANVAPSEPSDNARSLMRKLGTAPEVEPPAEISDERMIEAQAAIDAAQDRIAEEQVAPDAYEDPADMFGDDFEPVDPTQQDAAA